MIRFTPLLSLTIALGLAAAGAACSVSTPGSEDQPAADTTAATDGGAAAMPPLEGAINPQIVSTLAAAGMTVDDLPANLDDVANDPNHAKLHAVMKTFTIALGVDCTRSCYATADGGMPDFEANTPKKNVARKMWSNFVGQLKKADGSAIYCDTCHQGTMEFLDRSNDRALGTWMKTNFVGGSLARKDGTDAVVHECAPRQPVQRQLPRRLGAGPDGRYDGRRGVQTDDYGARLLRGVADGTLSDRRICVGYNARYKSRLSSPRR